MALSRLITIQVSLLGGSAGCWQGGALGEGSQALVWILRVRERTGASSSTGLGFEDLYLSHHALPAKTRG